MPERTLDYGDLEAAMGRAVKAAQKELRAVLGKRASVVVNVATGTHAFGSRVPARPPRLLAQSLDASAEEAENA
jgi:hypothetical protein